MGAQKFKDDFLSVFNSKDKNVTSVDTTLLIDQLNQQREIILQHERQITIMHGIIKDLIESSSLLSGIVIGHDKKIKEYDLAREYRERKDSDRDFYDEYNVEEENNDQN